MNNNLIIWDWNGTLLDDIDACLKSINQMLEKRGMDRLSSTFYKEVFTFPVQDYYKCIGFDFNKESFGDLSVEYVKLYKEYSKNSKLHKGAKETLNFMELQGFNQVIVSASEQNALEDQIRKQNIGIYFNSIIGLDNIHAKSKKDNAIKFLKDNNGFKKITLIGDTYHDYEVAQALGCECILVNNGHQYLKRFNLNGNTRIVENLLEINKLFN